MIIIEGTKIKLKITNDLLSMYMVCEDKYGKIAYEKNLSKVFNLDIDVKDIKREYLIKVESLVSYVDDNHMILNGKGYDYYRHEIEEEALSSLIKILTKELNIHILNKTNKNENSIISRALKLEEDKIKIHVGPSRTVMYVGYEKHETKTNDLIKDIYKIYSKDKTQYNVLVNIIYENMKSLYSHDYNYKTVILAMNILSSFKYEQSYRFNNNTKENGFSVGTCTDLF